MSGFPSDKQKANPNFSIKSGIDGIMANFSDTTKVYVYTDKNNLMILNNELKPVKSISVNDIYYCYLETNEYRFLENRNTTIVINKSGHEIANLNISGNVTLRGNRLFEVEENRLIEFNINQLNQNQ